MKTPRSVPLVLAAIGLVALTRVAPLKAGIKLVLRDPAPPQHVVFVPGGNKSQREVAIENIARSSEYLDDMIHYYQTVSGAPETYAEETANLPAVKVNYANERKFLLEQNRQLENWAKGNTDIASARFFYESLLDNSGNINP